MKKKAYIQPKTNEHLIRTESVMQAPVTSQEIGSGFEEGAKVYYGTSGTQLQIKDVWED